LKKGISDISAKTISSWICRTILLAYESSGEKFLNRHAVKAHEVRALASSWALFNSASISEVLSAGFWRCQDSFTSFYLRSMSAQADSLFSARRIVRQIQEEIVLAEMSEIPFFKGRKSLVFLGG
jgi:DNA-binding LytR/AlgR family response regulator